MVMGWSCGWTSGVSSLISFRSSLAEEELEADADVDGVAELLLPAVAAWSLLVLILRLRGWTAVSDVELELAAFDWLDWFEVEPELPVELLAVVEVDELAVTGGLFGLLVPDSESPSFGFPPLGLALLPSFPCPPLTAPPPASPLFDAGDGAALLCCICGDELLDRSTDPP